MRMIEYEMVNYKELTFTTDMHFCCSLSQYREIDSIRCPFDN